MNYHIDTIPVLDAMKLGGECPLCAIRRKAELQQIDRFLGASVMEPDVRVKVNAKGFCQRHYQMMFGAKNRLGLGLMLLSHLNDMKKDVDERLKKAEGGKGGLFRQKSDDPAASAAARLREIGSGCMICESLDEGMKRYAYTFLHLYQNDSEFKKSFENGKGVCLQDAALLLEMAPQALSGEKLRSFLAALHKQVSDNLNRLYGELEWFTLKFDYRNADKPWENSRDAVERTINKLEGWCVGEEPNPKDK